jgi:ribonuclease-3
MDENTLSQIEQVLDYEFCNPELLDLALTHSSYAENRIKSNERLEFLGDSVLAIVICQRLFAQFPDYLEGDLTKIKSMLVSRKTCSKIANQLGIVSFIKAGKGMEKTRAMAGSISAGVLEAIIAAIYLDGGFEAAGQFILKFFGEMIEKADAQQHQNNFKSMLQQHVQREFNTTPHYELLDEKGPDHNKCFESSVVIDERRFQSAWGVTKKEAEQKAAFNALEELGLIEPAVGS